MFACHGELKFEKSVIVVCLKSYTALYVFLIFFNRVVLKVKEPPQTRNLKKNLILAFEMVVCMVAIFFAF